MRLFAPAPNPVVDSLYARHVNPQWVRLLDLLQMNVDYVRCEGAELFTADGRRILDFLSGYCVHNVGHNHPRIVAAIKDELEQCGPAMLQSHVPATAGELAARLCAKAGGRLTKAFFASSGSEGIEAVIKFARAHTGRSGLLHADGGFPRAHLRRAVADEQPVLDRGVRPLAAPTLAAVPFGDLDALAARLMTRRFAAFVVEPVQAESGIRVPRAATSRPPRRSAARPGRSSSSTRCRRASIAPAPSSPRITSASSRTWSCSPRP